MPLPPPEAARADTSAAVSAEKPVPVFSTYQSSLKWLYDRVDVERTNPSRLDHDTFKLDRMRALAELLGNPQRATRFVHVAGTKGKGSTCEMTAACLEACGYTVGLYTSPHLIDTRERIRIDRRPISQAEFLRVAQRVAEAASRLPRPDPADPASGEPTFFELITAMALVCFAEQAVDVAVMEVGLGGRLDSTNIITPDVCAITGISLDHTQILGDTVEKIAREKAGILKPNVPALAIQQSESVLGVFREVAAEVGAPLEIVGRDVDFSYRTEITPSGPVTRVTLTSPRNNFEHVPVPLRGEHQALNCGLALAIIDKLSERGFRTPGAKVAQGLASVQMPGRFELAWSSPRIVLDGAHNADSVRCLMKAMSAHLTYDSAVVVFGCAADKDIEGMLREISAGADKVIFTRTAGNARAADPRELARRFSEATGKTCQSAQNLPEALNLAARAVGRGDVILVTGSLHLVGEAKKHLGAIAAKRGGSRG